MNAAIFITETDAQRLRRLLAAATQRPGSDGLNLQRLEAELDRAQIVPETDLPPEVITMNSTVEVEDLDDGERSVFTLVFPEHADVSQGRISVLAPLGMAMLGYRVGDSIQWPGPVGTLHVRVLRRLEPVAVS